MDKEAQEKIAELEHEQWIYWSQAVADEVETVKRAKWKKLWIPYSELTEEQKDQDRRWAILVLDIIEELGYRKLPKDKPPLLNDEQLIELGYGMTTVLEEPPERCVGYLRDIAQAQREADIKHCGKRVKVAT